MKVHVVSRDIMPRGIQAFRVHDTMIMHPKAYAALLWETGEKDAWRGRDRRRLKRERRKFIARRSA